MPKSIVARTTLAIVLLALLLGAVFAGLAAWTLHNNEQDRLTTRLDALLQTVEKTVSIACFVKDGALAREIVSGLMSNEARSDEHTSELQSLMRNSYAVFC